MKKALRILSVLFLAALMICTPVIASAAEKPVYKDVNGKEYELITFEKPYTSDGEVYEGNWTDINPDGSVMGKLTDGNICTDGEDHNVACWKGETVKIKIDLGELYTVKAFKTDLFGYFDWGIPDPAKATVNVFVSEDGQNFESLGKATAGEKTKVNFERVEFTLIPDKEVKAKEIIFEFNLDFENVGIFCWTSECAAFGELAKNEQEPETPEESDKEESDSETPEESEHGSVSQESTENTPAESSADPTESEETEVPQTGDTGIIFLIILAVLSIAVAAFIIVKKVRTKA